VAFGLSLEAEGFNQNRRQHKGGREAQNFKGGRGPIGSWDASQKRNKRK
jgi:hypothetical protein